MRFEVATESSDGFTTQPLPGDRHNIHTQQEAFCTLYALDCDKSSICVCVIMCGDR